CTKAALRIALNNASPCCTRMRPQRRLLSARTMVRTSWSASSGSLSAMVLTGPRRFGRCGKKILAHSLECRIISSCVPVLVLVPYKQGVGLRPGASLLRKFGERQGAQEGLTALSLPGDGAAPNDALHARLGGRNHRQGL